MPAINLQGRENTDAPQPEKLLGELLDVVERFNRLIVVGPDSGYQRGTDQENKDPTVSWNLVLLIAIQVGEER